MFGYYRKEWTNSDRFTWTLPQCVLSLALIAVSFDLYDGAKNVHKKKNDKKLLNLDTALEKEPELLEFFGKLYFAPSFLIGPQIGFKDYREFSQQKNNQNNVCLYPSFQRSLVALLYFSIQMIGAQFLRQKFFLSSEFVSFLF